MQHQDPVASGQQDDIYAGTCWLHFAATNKPFFTVITVQNDTRKWLVVDWTVQTKHLAYMSFLQFCAKIHSQQSLHLQQCSLTFEMMLG